MMVLLLPFLLIRFVWSQAIQKQASTKTGKRCPMKLELNYKNLCEIPFNNAIKFPRQNFAQVQKQGFRRIHPENVDGIRG